jgi:cation diffusion facilitator CzcD-associated flavoprotein CzcO
VDACDVLIVGAGPAGLASAACLTHRRVPFILIEAGQKVGASWRRHYDRLNRTPVRPSWRGRELFDGPVVHSADYQSGARFRGQRVLVVGIGNTGAEIALDLCEHGARVFLSVRRPQNILPREFLGTPLQVTSMRTARG